MLLRLTESTLEVANTGAPLTMAGVSAASTLRASAKRATGSIGHFGVGFTAVLSVTEAPELISRTGAVRWSRDLTLEAVAGVPALADELSRRRHQVPILRLPFPLASSAAAVPAGYDTVVRLPLGPEAAEIARRLLDGIDPTLLLVLPALAEVTLEVDGRQPRRFRCEWEGPDALLAGTRWRGVERSGRIPAALLDTLGVEEQARDTYEVRVLVPDDEWPQEIARVLRAPQPTDEPLALPAFVSATMPVEPGRRRIVPGPVSDLLLDEIAGALTELAERTGDLRLVPTGIPVGPVDAAIGDALRRRLPDARLLPGSRRGADTAVLDVGPSSDAIADLLRADVPALLPAPLTGPRWAAARRVLGVAEIGPGDLVTLLAGLARPAGWWAALYPALAPIPDRDALAALPVPLADGRTITGPRGVLLPGPTLDVAALAGLGLRLADPAVCGGVSGELLRGLGALDADPGVLLADPAVTTDDVPHAAVLALVAALAPHFAGVPDDLGERLLLPGDDGDLWPATELLLAGGPLAQVVRDDAPFGRLAGEVTAAFDPAVLEAAGVLRTFGVLRAPDVMLDPDDPVLLELDASDEWLADLPAAAAPAISDFCAIRDLELVRWPDALEVLAGPELRATVLGSPYTLWWLANHPVLPGGRLPRETALPGELAALHDPAPVSDVLDAEFLAAIGVRTSVAALADTDDLYDVLDRIADPERELSWPQARALYLAIAGALGGAGDDAPPSMVRTASGVVPAERALVVDRPDLLPLLGNFAPLRVPPGGAREVASTLGLRLASAAVDARVVSREPLEVTDADGVARRVSWFGKLHDGTPEGQARAAAWSSGRWSERHAIAERLRDPKAAEFLDAEADLDG